MKIKTDEMKNIDSLLKRILKDDIPPPLENRLRKELIRFKKKLREAKYQSKVVGLKSLMIERKLKRIALSFASILLVIIGGFLQEAGTPYALSDSLSAFHTAAAVNSRMRRVDHMDCVARIESENGSSLVYSIEWNSNGIITVARKERDGTYKKIIDAKNENLEYYDDPQIARLLHLVSPRRLAEQWQVEWRLQRFRKEGDCQVGTFVFDKPPDVHTTEIMVNMCTYLPDRIVEAINPGNEIGISGRGRLRAKFDWGRIRPLSPLLFSMKEEIK